MITIMFTGYSVSDEYIQNTRVDVDDLFLQYYPDVDIETLINKEEEEQRKLYSDNLDDVYVTGRPTVELE